MRVLFSTIGSRGDVQPLVALASYLKALGHEVRVCVPPDFREWIESLGIPVVPIGPEVRRFAASRPMAAQPQKPLTAALRRQMAEATVATQFETLTAAAQGCDVIVAATALQVAARSVAEKAGIAYVFAAYAPVVLPSPHHPPLPLPGQAPPATNDNRELWAQDGARFHDLFGAAVNAHRASLGLAEIGDVRSHMMTDRPWLAADAVLGPWPDPTEVRVFQTGAWILPDERPLSRELERFLESGDPPIYFGFGSTRAPEEAGPVLLHAARALGRRAIASQGWFDDSLLANEPDCLSIGEVNLHALFPRVAAVVHHGGAGTTTAAALAGSPQVVIPNHYDQHYWARRVDSLCIGTALAAGAPTKDSLASALAQSLRPEVAARAAAVAGTVRRDGTKIAAESLGAIER
ncbi:MAG TPA: glycosyltransferase [Bryobacteraceae bacterium]|jgi:vancomycin aglycone glucosyltransferase|nr:glycosyltransferase [Bryobacteraceae bacterium]